MSDFSQFGVTSRRLVQIDDGNRMQTELNYLLPRFCFKFVQLLRYFFVFVLFG